MIPVSLRKAIGHRPSAPRSENRWEAKYAERLRVRLAAGDAGSARWRRPGRRRLIVRSVARRRCGL